MQEIIILVGCGRAGKTTYAKKIAKEKGYEYISVDGNYHYGGEEEYFRFVNSVADTLNSAPGKNFILDGYLDHDGHFKYLKSKLKYHKIKPVLVFTNCEVVRSRGSGGGTLRSAEYIIEKYKDFRESWDFEEFVEGNGVNKKVETYEEALRIVENKETLTELAEKHKTNKLKEGYMPLYESYVNKLKDKEINLMEIGVLRGASINMWHDYFKKAKIYGIDTKPKIKFKKERVKIYTGDQADKEFLENVCEDKRFDIIIDDGGHKMSQQIGSFKILWKYLKSGGLYVMEDLHTSYHKIFLDLDYTTMDFLLTRLHDLNLSGKRENNIDDLNEYEKTIEFMHFYKSIVFIKKKEEEK